ncbi:MAG: hypothetical protein ACK57U_02320, partial [Planctomycetota bacterium]
QTGQHSAPAARHQSRHPAIPQLICAEPRFPAARLLLERVASPFAASIGINSMQLPPVDRK